MQLTLSQHAALRDITGELTRAAAEAALSTVRQVSDLTLRCELARALQMVFRDRTTQFSVGQNDHRDFMRLTERAGDLVQETRRRLADAGDIGGATEDGLSVPMAALMRESELLAVLAPKPVIVVGRGATRRISLGV